MVSPCPVFFPGITLSIGTGWMRKRVGLLERLVRYNQEATYFCLQYPTELMYKRLIEAEDGCPKADKYITFEKAPKKIDRLCNKVKSCDSDFIAIDNTHLIEYDEVDRYELLVTTNSNLVVFVDINEDEEHEWKDTLVNE